MANANETQTANESETGANGEILRISNLKSVAQKLEIQEGRVRALVREGALEYTVGSIPGTDFEINFISDDNIAEYRRKLASGEIGGRKLPDHTPFVVYIPNAEIETITAQWTANGWKNMLRNKPKSETDSNGEPETNGDSGDSEPETARRTRNRANGANGDNIPQ